jgi:hypothetical protein
MRVGLNLRVNLIVAPLVVAMLALALAPIASYLSLRAALHDVRREIAFLLHLSRLDILAGLQSVESFGAAFHGEDTGDLRGVESEARAILDALAGWDLPPRRAELLERIERAYARSAAASARAVELARRGERKAATRLVTATQRDTELLPLVDAAQNEGSLALRKALDSLLTNSARLSMVPPLAGLAADTQRLRAEAAEAISATREVAAVIAEAIVDLALRDAEHGGGLGGPAAHRHHGLEDGRPLDLGQRAAGDHHLQRIVGGPRHRLTLRPGIRRSVSTTCGRNSPSNSRARKALSAVATS